MSPPRLQRPVSVPRNRQVNDILLADAHFWNYQGREVLVHSLIDEAARFPRHSNSAFTSAWVKWAGAQRFLLVDPHRPHLAWQFIEQLGARCTSSRVNCRSYMDPWSCGTSWSVCAIHGRENGSRWSA